MREPRGRIERKRDGGERRKNVWDWLGRENRNRVASFPLISGPI